MRIAYDREVVIILTSSNRIQKSGRCSEEASPERVSISSARVARSQGQNYAAFVGMSAKVTKVNPLLIRASRY